MTTFPVGGGFEGLVAILAHVVSWAVACWILGLVAIVGTFRLLCEWQRRTTLIAIVRNAPLGTVVIQERGLGGPAMWIQVGYSARWIASDGTGWIVAQQPSISGFGT